MEALDPQRPSRPGHLSETREGPNGPTFTKIQHKMPWKSLKILESLLSLLSLTSLAVPKCLGCSFPVLDVLTHFRNFNFIFFSSKLSSWNAASDSLWHGPWISKGPGMARSSNEFQWVPCWPMPKNSDRCWLCRLHATSNCSAFPAHLWIFQLFGGCTPASRHVRSKGPLIFQASDASLNGKTRKKRCFRT